MLTQLTKLKKIGLCFDLVLSDWKFWSHLKVSNYYYSNALKLMSIFTYNLSFIDQFDLIVFSKRV